MADQVVNTGMIHNEVDLKLLILYVLRRLPSPVDMETLFEICICDNGVEYFDYAEYLHELADNGNIQVTEDGEYVITEKGRRNGEEVENSLPKSVRIAADAALAPVAKLLLRYSLVKAEQIESEYGPQVHLALSDGEISLLDLQIYCGDVERAKVIRRNFRKNAESCYTRILDILTENKRRIK